MTGRSLRLQGRDERAAASVLAVVLLGALVAVALASGACAALLVGQRRAAAAADLAALAAAQAIASAEAPASGRDAPCERAARVTAAHDARLRLCLSQGQDVVVEVVVDVPLLLGRTVHVPGRARAGPTRGPRDLPS